MRTPREREQRQLRLWVRGRSRHDLVSDTCCPDYSCCRPELQAPLELREHYAALVTQGDLWGVLRLRLAFLQRTITEVSATIEA